MNIVFTEEEFIEMVNVFYDYVQIAELEANSSTAEHGHKIIQQILDKARGSGLNLEVDKCTSLVDDRFKGTLYDGKSIKPPRTDSEIKQNDMDELTLNLRRSIAAIGVDIKYKYENYLANDDTAYMIMEEIKNAIDDQVCYLGFRYGLQNLKYWIDVISAGFEEETKSMFEKDIKLKIEFKIKSPPCIFNIPVQIVLV